MAAALKPEADDVVVAAVPWQDLPEELTEKALERLSAYDYVRFGAVCRGWRAIQRDHRRRHSPSSPPAVNIPCFIPYRPREESVVCSLGLPSSGHQRLRIPFSSTYLASLESKVAAEGTEDPACSSLPYGWLLFDDWPFFWYRHRSYEFSLLNPLTGAQISLPILGDLYDDFKATISPPPRCDVFVLTADTWGNKLHLYRQGDPDWTYLWLDWAVPMAVSSVIYYDGKFYCFRLGQDFMAFDIDCPTEDQMEPHFLEMDQSLLPKDDRPSDIEERLEVFLVESNGKMLLVCEYFVYDPSHRTRTLERFELFEADLPHRRWLKAEGLGDQALIIYRKFAVSLTAADVGVKRNCIYIHDAPMNIYKQDAPRNERKLVPWNMFDLNTGELADAFLPFPPSPLTHLMFVPSIY